MKTENINNHGRYRIDGDRADNYSMGRFTENDHPKACYENDDTASGEHHHAGQG